FPERGLARPKAASESFVDHRRARSCVAILVGEIAAFHQVHTQGGHEPRRRRRGHRRWDIRPAFLGRPFDEYVVVVDVQTERNKIRQPRILNPRYAAHSLEQITLELFAARTIVTLEV